MNVILCLETDCRMSDRVEEVLDNIFGTFRVVAKLTKRIQSCSSSLRDRKEGLMLIITGLFKDMKL